MFFVLFFCGFLMFIYYYFSLFFFYLYIKNLFISIILPINITITKRHKRSGSNPQAFMLHTQTKISRNSGDNAHAFEIQQANTTIYALSHRIFRDSSQMGRILSISHNTITPLRQSDSFHRMKKKFQRERFC